MTSKEAWKKWFEQVGSHATVDVVNATATLVINERDIAAEAGQSTLKSIGLSDEQVDRILKGEPL